MSIAFPACKDEVSPAEKIVFHIPALYNKKVKIHEWQMHNEAEPKDNRDIFPPEGNLHKSTYRRFGSERSCTGVSETHAMLSQIELKDQYKQIHPHRALLNMRALAPADEEDEEAKLTDILINPEDLRSMDYRSTMTIDYRLPYPIKPRPKAVPPPIEPWLLNRRIISCMPHDLEKRDGINMFMDDNLEFQQSVAELKSRRHSMYSTIFNSNGEQIQQLTN